MLRVLQALIITGLLAAFSSGVIAQTADKAVAGNAVEKSAASLPVKELTVFKDGHAFVLQEGEMPVANGEVVLDCLPTPVMGTFWPYSADEKIKLLSVTSSQRVTAVQSTALSLRELLEANVGAEVTIREDSSKEYDATIVGIPERSSQELEKTSAPGTPAALPVKGNIILLKRADGTKAISMDRIQDVTFKGKPKTVGSNVVFRNSLQMKLDMPKDKAPAEVKVGMIYLQKGFRWIPNYKVNIDGKGQAQVKMEATLINELADLDDATVHLVVGAPSFAMADVVDPIALQQGLAQLSEHFRTGTRFGNQNISNALMSQVSSNASMQMPEGPQPPAAMDLGAAIPDGKKVEDLFVFPVQHISLKKGQRMVVPVAEFTVKYRDIYTLDLPSAPPGEVWKNTGNDRQAELARMLNQPKVMHKIRLANSTKSPFTTAPALVTMDNRLMAQGMMLYTPSGGEVDLAITPAIDIAVRKTDTETTRTPNAANFDGLEFFRVDLDSEITLLSRKKEAVEVEVTREVLGNISKADSDGKIQMLSVLDDDAAVATAREPFWWSWYSWPYWWSQFNGMGKVTWTVKLEPGKKVELKYSWNYFWR